MPTPQKAKSIDELTDQLTRSKLIIVTDYRGLKVTDLQTLRGNLRTSGGEFRVAKNTLTRIAAEQRWHRRTGAASGRSDARWRSPIDDIVQSRRRPSPTSSARPAS